MRPYLGKCARFRDEQIAETFYVDIKQICSQIVETTEKLAQK